jgi:putative oxidoreductase
MIDDVALLATRFAVGLGMASHGSQKALGWFGGPGPEGAASSFEMLGFRPGARYAPLAANTEIASGLLIALGLGGPAGPAALIGTMLVAQVAVHLNNGFFASKNGIELGTLYGAAALGLAASGYGRLSLDAAFGLRERLRHPMLTTLALGSAIAMGWAILATREAVIDAPPPPSAEELR